MIDHRHERIDFLTSAYLIFESGQKDILEYCLIARDCRFTDLVSSFFFCVVEGCKLSLIAGYSVKRLLDLRSVLVKGESG